MKQGIELPVTLTPSRLKMGALLGVCALFVAGAVWMVRDGNPLGYLCGGFFALGLPVFALQLHPRASYLRLEADRFTVCSLFRAHTVRWADVQGFGMARIGATPMVAWSYAPHVKVSGALPGRARALSRRLSGYDAALPDTYGMKAQELVALLEMLRRSTVPARQIRLVV